MPVIYWELKKYKNMNSDRYNKFSAFLRERFGGRVEKICVDGGFSCPNGGCCTFCGEDEGRGEDIAAQVKRQLSAPAKNGADKFIVYFQSRTNTYADIPTLKSRYDAALIDPRICALAIATRPDCIDEEIADLLATHYAKYYVWVELGLQTASDATAKAINRGYGSEVYRAAAGMLSARGIDVVAHIIFGLPGETDADIDRTVDFINDSTAAGVKIHSLYVTKDAPIYNLYKNGGYVPQTFEEHTRRTVRAITRLRPDIIIHRITGDAPRGKLVAPEWNNRKKLIRNAVERELQRQNLVQGCFYTNGGADTSAVNKDKKIHANRVQLLNSKI